MVIEVISEVVDEEEGVDGVRIVVIGAGKQNGITEHSEMIEVLHLFGMIEVAIAIAIAGSVVIASEVAERLLPKHAPDHRAMDLATAETDRQT